MSTELIAFNENEVKTKQEMRDAIMRLEAAMLAMPEHHIEIKTTHYFTPGVYMREVVIPKGATLTGYIHKTEHMNILSSGKLKLITEDGFQEVAAPFTVKSLPGIKRGAHALEESTWTTIHPNPTNETDIEKLANSLVVDTYEKFIAFKEEQKLILEDPKCHL